MIGCGRSLVGPLSRSMAYMGAAVHYSADSSQQMSVSFPRVGGALLICYNNRLNYPCSLIFGNFSRQRSCFSQECGDLSCNQCLQSGQRSFNEVCPGSDKCIVVLLTKATGTRTSGQIKLSSAAKLFSSCSLILQVSNSSFSSYF